MTRAGRVGYCPQEPVLYARLTCDEHFELYGHACGMTVTPMREARRDTIDAPPEPAWPWLVQAGR